MWCVELLAAADKEKKPLDSALFSAMQESLAERLSSFRIAAGHCVVKNQGGIYDVSGLPVRGGTTASILRIDPTTGAITCASVGDSEVRYYDMSSGTGEDDGKTLCGDHSATNPEEYARVLAFCAEKDRGVPRFAYDTQGGRLSRESRCQFVRAEGGVTWKPNPAGGFFYCDVRGNYGAYMHTPTDNEGLAMTRALGDFNMSRYGVSQEPHVVTAIPPALTEDAQIRAVVWASDGMWDLVSPADVGAVVRRAEFIVRASDNGQILCGRAEAAAAALLTLAKERTRAAFGGSLGDNITVGVTYIVYPRAPITEMTPAAWEHAITRHRVHHGAALGHSEREGERDQGERNMVGKPPGTGDVFSTRRSTQRVLYRALDGSYWEIVYLNGQVNGISPWHSPLAPEELDMAFLLSGSPFHPESIFAGLDVIPFAEPAVSFALPGSTAALIVDDEDDDPLHCDLHRYQVLPDMLGGPGAGLRRSRNTARSYGSYAPSCSGCRIGAAEEAADAAADAELKTCTEWLNLQINSLTDASIAGGETTGCRTAVEDGMIRLEACDAWVCFSDPAVMRSATAALAADDAATDIRRAMNIIAETKELLKAATGRLRATPMGAGYAAYKIAMAFLEENP